MEATDLMTDAAYLKSLPLYKMVGELESWNRRGLQAVAKELGLPIRYDDNHLKPKDVLAAAIFEALRKASDEKLHEEALAQGYKDENCSECGTLFLAHKHLVRCNSSTCPMKDGQGSLLDRLAKDVGL